MEEAKQNKQIGLRYHLDNNKPVDLIEFTKGLQALHDEYVHYMHQQGEAHTKARLDIYKVEEGSIIFELIEALPSLGDGIQTVLGHTNTIVQFGEYLMRIILALARGSEIPSEGRNTRSLDNISSFIQPLASSSDSTMNVSVVERIGGDVTIYNNCSFGVNSTEGNAIQDRVHSTKEQLAEEVVKTEESKEKVLLRIMQINKEQETQQDKGIIEAFGSNKKKLIFESDDVKRAITGGDENFFKYLYLVDVVAMFNEGKLVAYRIPKVHDTIDPEDE